MFEIKSRIRIPHDPLMPNLVSICSCGSFCDWAVFELRTKLETSDISLNPVPVSDAVKFSIINDP